MKKVNQLISNPYLHERLEQLDRLTIILEQCLGLSLENRVWPLLRKRRLILLTDDPHFATQARFMQKALCKHLDDQLHLKISAVDIKLLSLPLASNNQNSTRNQISNKTREILDSIADSIGDETLSASLKRVASASCIKQANGLQP